MTSLHPILEEKLNQALLPAPPRTATRRDARLPGIAGKAHSVIGMRRAGKTTFLQQVQEDLRSGLPAERALYISLDDERLIGVQVDQLGLLLEEYYRRFPRWRGHETAHWLLDEVQFVPDWERFVRRVMDTEKIEFVVSGSSARKLSREVHSSLRGRGVATVIRPFSFREFLRHRGEEPVGELSRLAPAARSLVEQYFREYLSVGGFPEVQLLPPQLRLELLQGYVDGVILRDVVERHGVSQVAALRWVVRHCLRNPARAFSALGMYRDLRAQGHAVSKDAVHAILAHLRDAFLINTVMLATESERKRNVNPRKIYPADPGLIGAFDSSGRVNLGHALETVVQNELERRGAEFGYVKTEEGFEVDFLARIPGAQAELVQVCADLSSPGTMQRELQSLASAGREYPRARRRLLLLDRPTELVGAQEGIVAQAVYEWLLEGDRVPR